MGTFSAPQLEYPAAELACWPTRPAFLAKHGATPDPNSKRPHRLSSLRLWTSLSSFEQHPLFYATRDPELGMVNAVWKGAFELGGREEESSITRYNHACGKTGILRALNTLSYSTVL